MNNRVKDLRGLARAAEDFGDFNRQEILEAAANELEEALNEVVQARHKVAAEAGTLRRWQRQNMEFRAEVARLRAVLDEIAKQDYRGNRSHESTIAERALRAASTVEAQRK